MRLLLAALVLIALPAGAQTCAPEALRAVSPVISARHEAVQVAFSLENGSTLHVVFQVRAPDINAREHLGPGEYPFQFDVVEVFVSASGASVPYYEFEVSPFAETFQVQVIDPKKTFINGVDMGLKAAAHPTPNGWTAEMTIPLASLGWTGRVEDVIGNAFAVLGHSPHRSYRSLFWDRALPLTKTPKFHQPQYFRVLLRCS